MEQYTQGSRFIDTYIPLVHFLGEFLGQNCEVILHDVSAKENSALAIANGHISGRKAGAPLTDLALRFVMDGTYRTTNWVTGYRTTAKDGTPLHSATYFIKDTSGELHGMLCLNMDTSDILEARHLLEKVIKASGLTSQKQVQRKSPLPEKTENIPEQDNNQQSSDSAAEQLKQALAGKCIVRKSSDRPSVLLADCGLYARNEHPETPPPADSEDVTETYEANRNVPHVAAQIGQAYHRGNTSRMHNASSIQNAGNEAADTFGHTAGEKNTEPTPYAQDDSIQLANRTSHGTVRQNSFSTHTERFSQSLEELTEGLIRDTITQAHIEPERMTPAEKQEVVASLHEKGVFLLKGAVHSVAKALSTSEATIYRYLQEIAENG